MVASSSSWEENWVCDERMMRKKEEKVIVTGEQRRVFSLNI